MAGSVIGDIFRVSTFGESHGAALGAVIDGCPAGLALYEADIAAFLSRRRGGGAFATKRREADAPHIVSGVFNDYTTGCPVCILINNENARSGDYENLKDVFRPSHADYGYHIKYINRDYRGGGRSSGRETVSRVAAGAVAVKILNELGVTFQTYVRAAGPFECDEKNFDAAFINQNPLFMADKAAYEKAAAYLAELEKQGDSAGGAVECRVFGLPAGIGQPVFDKLDALISRAIFSIGAVKAVEFGLGAQCAKKTAGEINDAFFTRNGEIRKKTNNSGGVTGGLSDGAQLLIKAYFKPTPSVSKQQQTVNTKGENIKIQIKGRHDPIIAPRAAVVVESMTAITLCDLIFQGLSARMDVIKRALV